MLEHVVAKAQGGFNGFLCFSTIALCFICDDLLLIVHIELEHIGFTTTFNLVALITGHKVQGYQHAFAIGLVDQIVLADIAQCRAIQGIAKSIDDCGLACAVTATIATKIEIFT